MLSCGFETDEFNYINMLATFVKAGDVEIGEMFDYMACLSVSSW